MTRILIINGSYRDDGITDRTLDIMTETLTDANAEVDVVLLREYPIEFCHNCRQCTQQPGSKPGECVIDDGLQQLVERIEQADAYILASPTNFGSVTAAFKRLMERLVVYAYWPWGAKFPQFRKQSGPRKKAVLVSSSAAPGVLGKWMFGSLKQLKMTAKVIGADTTGTLFTGLVSSENHPALPQKSEQRARHLALKLA